MTDLHAAHAMRGPQALRQQLLALLDDVLAHDGYGSIHIDVRLLKKGQKEVILDCGKQYRFVVDHLPSGGGSPTRP
jgi:hypothetical protein